MEDDTRPLIEIEILNLHVRLSLIMCNVLTVVFGICGNALALIIVTRSRYVINAEEQEKLPTGCM